MKPRAPAALRVLSIAVALAITPTLAGCGYTLANTPDDGGLGPLTVLAEEARTPDVAALDAAIEGAQRELARAGLLAPRGGGATLTIALLRVDERSEGVARGGGAPGEPVARGIRLTLVGRAVARGSSASRPSGEVTVSEVFAGAGGAAAGILGRSEAARRAGVRLGERLARRVLGEPDPDGAVSY